MIILSKEEARNAIANFLLLGGRQPTCDEILLARQDAHERGDQMAYEAINLAERYMKKMCYYMETAKCDIPIHTDKPYDSQQAINKAIDILKTEVRLEHNWDGRGCLMSKMYDTDEKYIGVIVLEWNHGVFQANFYED